MQDPLRFNLMTTFKVSSHYQTFPSVLTQFSQKYHFQIHISYFIYVLINYKCKGSIRVVKRNTTDSMLCNSDGGCGVELT